MSGGHVYRRGDVLVPLDRNPLELFLLGLCVISSLASSRVPGVPDWAAAGWRVLLGLGGATAIAGAYWRDALTGVLIVRAAMIWVGFGAYAYAVVAYFAVGPAAAATVVAFGISAHARALQISRNRHDQIVLRMPE